MARGQSRNILPMAITKADDTHACVGALTADGTWVRPEPVTLDLTEQVIFKEARVFGVTGRELFRSWQQTTTLLATGMVDIAPIVSGRFPLERFEDAFEAMASGRSAKVVFAIGEGGPV